MSVRRFLKETTFSQTTDTPQPTSPTSVGDFPGAGPQKTSAPKPKKTQSGYRVGNPTLNPTLLVLGNVSPSAVTIKSVLFEIE